MAKNYRIATLNLRNYIKSREFYYGTNVYTDSEFNAKNSWIRSQIKNAVQPHIIGFQEVFYPAGLKKICNKALKELVHFTTGGVTPTINEQGYYDRPCVALCSQLPFLMGEDAPAAIEDIPDEAILPVTLNNEPITKFSRHILRAAVEFEGMGKTILYVAHLKSKRPMTEEMPSGLNSFKDKIDFVLKNDATGSILSLLKRGAESAGLRYLIHEDLVKGNKVIFLGDLNDDINSVTTKTTVGQIPYAVGKTSDGKDNVWMLLDNHEKAQVYSYLLSSAIDMVTHRYPTPAFYTHEFNGEYEILDHIHFSNHFHPKNRSDSGVGEVKRVFILNDHLHDKETNPDKQTDHGILVAQIRARSR